MKKNINRRDFMKKSTLIAAGIGFGDKLYPSIVSNPVIKSELYNPSKIISVVKAPDIPFAPRRVASWWNTLDELLWSQKVIKDMVKRRAEGFASANIQTTARYDIACI